MPAQLPVRLHHLEIEGGALLTAAAPQEAAGAVELLEALAQLDLDACDRLQQVGARRHIVRIGIDP